ncbi:hypothetical protein TNCV_2534111 [Trichonephila clavipes]|nr:hypothetical protein TNCV_2534111 [Trichonephila clavipes]
MTAIVTLTDAGKVTQLGFPLLEERDGKMFIPPGGRLFLVDLFGQREGEREKIRRPFARCEVFASFSFFASGPVASRKKQQQYREAIVKIEIQIFVFFSRNNGFKLIFSCIVLTLVMGCGSLVVKGSWLARHEFEPGTTKDPACMVAVHVKSLESSNVLPLVWWGC